MCKHFHFTDEETVAQPGREELGWEPSFLAQAHTPDHRTPARTDTVGTKTPLESGSELCFHKSV